MYRNRKFHGMDQSRAVITVGVSSLHLSFCDICLRGTAPASSRRKRRVVVPLSRREGPDWPSLLFLSTKQTYPHHYYVWHGHPRGNERSNFASYCGYHISFFLAACIFVPSVENAFDTNTRLSNRDVSDLEIFLYRIFVVYDRKYVFIK